MTFIAVVNHGWSERIVLGAGTLGDMCDLAETRVVTAGSGTAEVYDSNGKLVREGSIVAADNYENDDSFVWED